ncbi:competence type IV pilus minor pilin ComGG [Streptococcus ruminantium]|uniref:competence type IV pilus minor pilin ComGG n=1 Tax=Streptococcus ruminantium TaxID=1917441 RepID=UPI0012DF5B06|nr:competence type IV pilus minor pilin ComGG [Streptococcus ruminantium]
MLLKKQVKAGILLYALLMLAIFSFILQFYLNRQIAESQLVQVSRQQATAYIMARWTLEDMLADQETRVQEKEEGVSTQKLQAEHLNPLSEGRNFYSTGEVTYRRENQSVKLVVRLGDGKSFSYQFPIPSQNEGFLIR